MAFWKKNTADYKLTDQTGDAELVSHYRETGDNGVIGIFFKRYYHLIYGLSLKYLKDEEDASEAAMQVFEQLYSSLKQHEVTNFKSWLYSVAKNHCLMILRKKNHTVRLDTAHYQNLGDDFMEFGDTFSLYPYGNGNDQEAKLKLALEELPDEQKICIEMFYLNDLTYKEISEKMNFSMNQVKSYIQNGKRNLKIILSGKS